MFNLSNKVAVVTGAGRGMGEAHARALALQGARVAVTDKREEDCRAVADGIALAGGESLACVMDVSKQEEIGAAFDAIAARFGRVDILVNNAGVFAPKPAFEISAEEWDASLAVNLRGQFLCAQRAAHDMMKRGWGRIINISSVSSGQVGIGAEGGAHYSASKGGVIAMTETLALEWARHGITVNAVAPGAIDTAMSRKHRLSEEESKKFLESIPLGRFGRPEEVSAAVVFLASEEASYVTGSTLYVDGGWLAA